jgi:hypothetical protein
VYRFHRRGGKLAITLALVCCVVADVSLLQWFWLRRSGQVAWGYFEAGDGGPRLVTEGYGEEWNFEATLASATRLWVSPGKPIIVPLGTDTDLTVTTSGSGRVPYLVFGALVPLGVTSTRNGRDVLALSHARTLEVGANGPVLAAWDATVPWEKDVERLRKVATSCARDPAASVHVVTLKESLRVDYGGCRLDLPLDDTSISALALLSGPNPLLVETNWKTNYATKLGDLLPIAVLASLSVAALHVGLGPGLCVVFSIVPVLIFIWFPVAGILAWVSASVVGLLFCGWRLLWYLPRRARWVLGLALPAIAAIVVVGLVWPRPTRILSGAETAAHADRVNVQPGPLPGVLLGYSAVAGSALRTDTDGLFEHLRRLAGAYVDLLSRRGFSGHTFARIEQSVCDEFDDVPNGSLVLFFGGTNDDWISDLRMSNLAPLWMVMLQLRAMSDVHRWERRELFDTRSALVLLPRQEQVITGAIRCGRARGDRFIFFHDFVISDLDGGLSPARRQMREARREAVARAGGEFVDLFDELHNDVGVAWFNDIIHPSSVGHEHIAARITRYLATNANPTARDAERTE